MLMLFFGIFKKHLTKSQKRGYLYSCEVLCVVDTSLFRLCNFKYNIIYIYNGEDASDCRQEYNT